MSGSNRIPPAPLVSLIIVQYSNPGYLWGCIRSIAGLTYSRIELIIVDNGSPKVSPADIPEVPFPVRYLPSETNLGFAGGCNRGIREAKGEFVFILNNDIEFDPACLTVLVEVMQADPRIGILQPKMLDLQDPRLFHSSAAGGLIDVLGYPFARGRILETVETDVGQYDRPIEVFWAGGACLFARKRVLEQAGLFDADFFLYMEEIDLAWRVHLLGGFKVVFIPSARVYHLGCPTLDREHLLRMYYVHRNSLVMLLKNYAWPTLLLVLPARIALDLLAALGPVLLGRWKRVAAVLSALGYLLSHAPAILRKRQAVQSRRSVTDRSLISKMHLGSIALRYLLAGKDVGRVLVTIPVVEYMQEAHLSC